MGPVGYFWITYSLILAWLVLFSAYLFKVLIFPTAYLFPAASLIWLIGITAAAVLRGEAGGSAEQQP